MLINYLTITCVFLHSFYIFLLNDRLNDTNSLLLQLAALFGPGKQAPHVGPMSMQDTKFLANVFARRCGALSAAPTTVSGIATTDHSARQPPRGIHHNAPAAAAGGGGGGGGGGDSGMYKPPFSHTSTVMVGVPFTPRSLPDLKRK